MIECIHCGFKFRIDLEKHVEDGETTTTRNIFKRRKEKRNLKSIDIVCSKCNRTFEYRVRT